MRKWIASFVVFGVVFALQAQTETNKKGSEYVFTEVKKMEATEVKNQHRTGTCWSFSGLSFLESELLRAGKGKIDLSEMYVVRCAYIEKALRYVLMGGKINFGQGGEFHDIPYITEKYGMVPDAVYSGLKQGETTFNHSEMETVLLAVLNEFVKKEPGTLSKDWIKTITSIVDSYLGVAPEKFNYNGKEFTPLSFYKQIGINLNDYVFLTSFTHHPMYSSFAIEVPDNWSMQAAYNVSLEELSSVAKESLKNGFSFAWAADVSEKGFSFNNGLGIIPNHDSMLKQTGKDNKHFNDGGAERAGNAFSKPMGEKSITPELRQDAFMNLSTTDDHGMHATALYTDQNGTAYFKIKNSWGTSNDLKGYLFVSEAYFKYKTICIMVHKNALNKNLQKTLNIL